MCADVGVPVVERVAEAASGAVERVEAEVVLQLRHQRRPERCLAVAPVDEDERLALARLEQMHMHARLLDVHVPRACRQVVEAQQVLLALRERRTGVVLRSHRLVSSQVRVAF
jgi:hypothetical protein